MSSHFFVVVCPTSVHTKDEKVSEIRYEGCQRHKQGERETCQASVGKGICCGETCH